MTPIEWIIIAAGAFIVLKGKNGATPASAQVPLQTALQQAQAAAAKAPAPASGSSGGSSGGGSGSGSSQTMQPSQLATFLSSLLHPAPAPLQTTQGGFNAGDSSANLGNIPELPTLPAYTIGSSGGFDGYAPDLVDLGNGNVQDTELIPITPPPDPYTWTPPASDPGTDTAPVAADDGSSDLGGSYDSGD
jgi:hypothetical protein